MSSADERGGRFDAAAGIVAVVLFAVAFFLPGAPPKASDSLSSITHFFVAKRGANLAADYLLGLGAVAFLWFLGSVRSYLRAAGEGRIAAVAFGGGVVGIALIICSVAVINGLAFKAADQNDQALVRALFDTSSALFALSTFGFAAFFAGVACSAARSHSLPGWLIWSGSALFLAQLVSGIALFVSSGVFAAGGAYGLVVTLVSFIWILGLSVLLVQRRGVPRSPV